MLERFSLFGYNIDDFEYLIKEENENDLIKQIEKEKEINVSYSFDNVRESSVEKKESNVYRAKKRRTVKKIVGTWKKNEKNRNIFFAFLWNVMI